MNFELNPLPFAENALEPHISERTIKFHYGKHHRGYMSKVEAALSDDSERREWSLEKIIANSEDNLFNSAAQVWNHDFYWQSLDPSGDSRPDAKLETQIDQDFGSMSALKDELKSVAAGEFGSGWAWLVFNRKEKKLQVTSTTDAETPAVDANLVPLLTIDVWEHAYYLDYQNARPAYLDALVDNLLNWQFASNNFGQ